VSPSEKYGIAIALIGTAMAVIQGMTGAIPPLLGWPIVAGCVVAAVALISRGRRWRQEVAGVKSQIAGKLEDISPQDANLILIMSIELDSRHGHNDITGLLADRASGVPLNELKTRPCSQCGIPRNQRSKAK
jgi:hypothetical protein